jgi:hypothetical protein
MHHSFHFSIYLHRGLNSRVIQVKFAARPIHFIAKGSSKLRPYISLHLRYAPLFLKGQSLLSIVQD